MTSTTTRDIHIIASGKETRRASDFLSSSSQVGFSIIRNAGEYLMVRNDQLWYWSDEWQSGEFKVENYIREGNIETFDTIDDFVHTLWD